MKKRRGNFIRSFYKIPFKFWRIGPSVFCDFQTYFGQKILQNPKNPTHPNSIKKNPTKSKKSHTSQFNKKNLTKSKKSHASQFNKKKFI
jgi:hypothetical protein